VSWQQRTRNETVTGRWHSVQDSPVTSITDNSRRCRDRTQCIALLVIWPCQVCTCYVQAITLQTPAALDRGSTNLVQSELVCSCLVQNVAHKIGSVTTVCLHERGVNEIGRGTAVHTTAPCCCLAAFIGSTCFRADQRCETKQIRTQSSRDAKPAPRRWHAAAADSGTTL
jgi:hypothetical protein